MDADAILRAAATVGLKLTALVNTAERDYERTPEDERDVRRAFLAAYIVARDTWAQYIAALGAEMEYGLVVEVEEGA